MALDKKYLRIAERLGLDVGEDRRARDVLDGMLESRDWGIVDCVIGGRDVIIFGGGPSLKEDIKKWKNMVNGMVKVACDGAAKALIEDGIIADVVVTDLDGDRRSLLISSGLGSILVVHAHGDNTSRLKSIVPKLAGVVYGTTQAEPTEKMRNFGGFTDGDRAVCLAERFKPNRIFLAGMDFGVEIGEYSGAAKNKSKNRKLQKLAIGKKLVEDLAA
ncbi:MAG: DUF115 domain-containing protein, partial [Candidatus Altiarchaeota archaeon]|nr:DUF115 domain-containing protein [Candidatus Altiarchaeota archaeon]